MADREPRALAGLLRVLALGLVARLAVLALLPDGAISADAHFWEVVAATLRRGQNPYTETSLLNWPPLWMMVIAALDWTARTLGFPFQRALVGLLIAADLVAMALTWLLVRRLWPRARADRWVAVGLALNPVSILLCCQHRNFDVLVALAVLAALLALERRARTGAVEDWLAACGWLGLGVLAKTVPLLLAPLLAPGARRARGLGVLLFLGPTALGLGVLAALAPAAVERNVLSYRSASGYYGLTGLLHQAGWLQAEAVVGRVAAPLFFLAAAVLTALFLRRDRPVAPAASAVGAAVLLFAVPVLGPGYAPQYVGWVLPLLTVVAASGERRLLRVLGVFAAILVCTDLAEYALLPTHGAWALHGSHPALVDRWSSAVRTQGGQTFLRLPLFVASLALLAELVRTWRRWLSEPQARTLAPGVSNA
jgi:glycosyl transferase family 87